MDPNSDICLVDVSYNVFYRFFALRQWYKRAHPDKNIPDNYDWLADEVFMTKYRKLFFENIFKVLKKRKSKGFVILSSQLIVIIKAFGDINIWRITKELELKVIKKTIFIVLVFLKSCIVIFSLPFSNK